MIAFKCSKLLYNYQQLYNYQLSTIIYAVLAVSNTIYILF